jgi:hypothetical protein
MPDEREIEIWGEGKADVIDATINGKPAEIKKEPRTIVKVPDLKGNGPWLISLTMPDGERAIKYDEWKKTKVTSANSTIDNASKNVVLGGHDDTNGLSAGMAVSGAGIPKNTVIEKIVDGTHLTLSNAATAAGNTTVLTFRTDPIEIKKTSDADELKSMVKAVGEAAESIVTGFEKSLDVSLTKVAERIDAAAEAVEEAAESIVTGFEKSLDASMTKAALIIAEAIARHFPPPGGSAPGNAIAGPQYPLGGVAPAQPPKEPPKKK